VVPHGMRDSDRRLLNIKAGPIRTAWPETP
jgi:hypothetical protein